MSGSPSEGRDRGPGVLIAMAGLPGTGKSTLAARLAGELGGAVLCKDVVRSALFPAPLIDYSAAQDDLCMEAIYAAAAHVLTADPPRTVVIDGRTFGRRSQVERLLAVAGRVGSRLSVIECVCADAVARGRIEADRAAGSHPAGNRDFALYLRQKRAAEPLTVPRLVLDTGELSADECVRRCLDHLAATA